MVTPTSHLLGAVFVAVGLVAVAATHDWNRVPDVTVDRVTDQQPLRIRDLRGKVVLVDFWQSWCGYTQNTLPFVEHLYKEFGAKGLEVVTISNEKAPPVAEFMHRTGFTFPTYLDREDQARKSFPYSNTSTVYVIDRNGSISAHLTRPQTEEEIRGALKDAGLN